MNGLFEENTFGLQPVLPTPKLFIPPKQTTQPVQPVQAVEETQVVQASPQNEQAVIVENTFQEDRDGTRYGIGSDGLTYSYVVGSQGPMNFFPLSLEQQKNAIFELTNGRIRIDDSITNQPYLSQIQRSINRMYQYGRGNLVPDDVVISDPRPGSYSLSGLGGMAYNTSRLNNNASAADEIELFGTSFPDFVTEDARNSLQEGLHTGGTTGEDVVPTHELAHTAQYAIDDITGRWLGKQLEEAERNMDKYPAEELFKQAVARLFGQNYELSRETDSVGAKIYKDAYEKFNRWINERKSAWDIFNEAVKNTGFSNLKEAAQSISGYAAQEQTNRSGSYVDKNEVFAEAYTDVLLNGESARPFSKELIRLYSDEADEWSEKTGRNKSKKIADFQELFDATPFGKTPFAYQMERTKKLLMNGGK